MKNDLRVTSTKHLPSEKQAYLLQWASYFRTPLNVRSRRVYSKTLKQRLYAPPPTSGSLQTNSGRAHVLPTQVAHSKRDKTKCITQRERESEKREKEKCMKTKASTLLPLTIPPSCVIQHTFVLTAKATPARERPHAHFAVEVRPRTWAQQDRLLLRRHRSSVFSETHRPILPIPSLPLTVPCATLGIGQAATPD